MGEESRKANDGAAEGTGIETAAITENTNETFHHPNPMLSDEFEQQNPGFSEQFTHAKTKTDDPLSGQFEEFTL